MEPLPRGDSAHTMFAMTAAPAALLPPRGCLARRALPAGGASSPMHIASSTSNALPRPAATLLRRGAVAMVLPNALPSARASTSAASSSLFIQRARFLLT
ncbi:MAG: hypothetical protein EOO41_04455, partial [Methanobacteriota archaeon]